MRLKICLDCSDYIIYLESNSAAILFFKNASKKNRQWGSHKYEIRMLSR